MTEDMAIRAGKKVPNTHQEMTMVTCDQADCDATFTIVHPSGYADMARAKRQVAHVKGVLHEEHLRHTFKDHYQSYDLEEID
jgi:hypothetical protein